jgi:hypothetical protein
MEDKIIGCIIDTTLVTALICFTGNYIFVTIKKWRFQDFLHSLRLIDERVWARNQHAKQSDSEFEKNVKIEFEYFTNAIKKCGKLHNAMNYSDKYVDWIEVTNHLKMTNFQKDLNDFLRTRLEQVQTIKQLQIFYSIINSDQSELVKNVFSRTIDGTFSRDLENKMAVKITVPE